MHTKEYLDVNGSPMETLSSRPTTRGRIPD